MVLGSLLPSSTEALPLTEAFRKDREWILTEIDASDRARGPTDLLMRYLLEKRVNLALVPTAYGGLGLGFIGEFDVIAEATRLSGTFGWIVFQLLGNPGRVLSFFSPEVVRRILSSVNGDLVISYQNDPTKARAVRDGERLLVSGRWSFGTLSKSATHFAIPFVDPVGGGETCLLLESHRVTRIDDWKNAAFRGSSITSYELLNHEISASDLVAPIQPANLDFNPAYTVPRSAIKHLAWSAGMALNVFDTIVESDPSKAGLPEWSRYEQNLSVVLDEVRSNVQLLQERLTHAPVGDLLQELNTRCSSVHQQALNGALAAFTALPRESLDDNSKVAKNMRDTLVLSLHKALRDGLSFLS